MKQKKLDRLERLIDKYSYFDPMEHRQVISVSIVENILEGNIKEKKEDNKNDI